MVVRRPAGPACRKTPTAVYGCIGAAVLAAAIATADASVLLIPQQLALGAASSDEGAPPRARKGQNGSLDALVDAADAIFVGKVDAVADREVTLPTRHGRVASAEIRDVTFKVSVVLKGDVPSRFTIAVSKELELDPPDEVLWYLSPASADHIYRAPVGLTAGYFRIVPDKEFGKLAVRQGGNRGLWRSDKSLWAGEAEQLRAKEYLETERHLKTDAATRLAAIGYEVCCAELLPLDFLLAATHTRVASSSSSAPR